MRHNSNNIFGEWLRECREEIGMNQKTAASAAEMHINQWSRIERGADTKEGTIIRMAAAVRASESEALQKYSEQKKSKMQSTAISPAPNTVRDAEKTLSKARKESIEEAIELENEAEVALRRGEQSHAEELLRQAILAAPDWEIPVQSLMKMLAEQERSSDVLAVYSNLVAAIRRPPTPRTRKLFRLLQNRDLEKKDPSRVGRQADLELILKDFTYSNLVTLTGPEGVGKTRLAELAVEEMGKEYHDGALLLPLQTVRHIWPESGDEQRVARALLFALRASIPLKQDAFDTLTAELRASTRFIVLDGYDGLEAEVALLMERISEKCQYVTMLATGRGELTVEANDLPPRTLPPLAVPDVGAGLTPEELDEETGVHLFQLQARAVSDNFKITPQNQGDVLEICRRAQGLPLYINLAASLMNLKSPEEIAHTMPADAEAEKWVQWLTEPLYAEADVLLSRLTVFPASWTTEAAEEICSDDPQTRRQIPTWLENLRENFLVFKGRNDRWHLWLPVRECRSMDEAEHNVRMNRLLEWCLQVADKADLVHRVNGIEERYNQLEEEMDNIRTALHWALTQPGKAASGMRLASLLWGLWNVRNYWTEGRYWLEQFLKNDDALAAEKPVLLDAWNGAGVLAIRQRDYDDARECLEKALSITRSLERPDQTGAVLNSLGFLCMRQERLEEAKENYQAARACYTNIAEKEGRPSRDLKWPLLGLGEIALAEKNLVEAKQYYEEILSLMKQVKKIQGVDDKDGVAQAEGALANVAREEGNLAGAAVYLKRSLLAAQQLKNMTDVSVRIDGLADLAVKQGVEREATTSPESQEALREMIKEAVRLYAGAREIRLSVGANARDGSGEYPTRPAVGSLLTENEIAQAWREGTERTTEETIGYAQQLSLL